MSPRRAPPPPAPEPAAIAATSSFAVFLRSPAAAHLITRASADLAPDAATPHGGTDPHLLWFDAACAAWKRMTPADRDAYAPPPPTVVPAVETRVTSRQLRSSSQQQQYLAAPSPLKARPASMRLVSGSSLCDGDDGSSRHSEGSVSA